MRVNSSSFVIGNGEGKGCVVGETKRKEDREKWENIDSDMKPLKKKKKGWVIIPSAVLFHPRVEVQWVICTCKGRAEILLWIIPDANWNSADAVVSGRDVSIHYLALLNCNLPWMLLLSWFCFSEMSEIMKSAWLFSCQLINNTIWKNNIYAPSRYRTSIDGKKLIMLIARTQ